MQPLNVHEYEKRAATLLDTMTYDYYRSGSEDEQTLRANREAFSHVRLRPRVLVDVSAVDLRTTVLGIPVSMPLLVPPMGYQCLATPEGELATARAAGRHGTLMTVSTLATKSLEEVAEAASGPLWFQLYVYGSRGISEQLIARAEAAGYQALVLTVDTPKIGRREPDMRNSFGLPPHLSMANFAGSGVPDPRPREPGVSALAASAAGDLDPSLTWEAVDWLRSKTRLPIILKGIMTGEDTEIAVRRGVEGIVVSNHGGRQLDGAMSTLEALPEVAEAAAGRCEVYLDGGVRRGSDVLKALALGARAVFMGRPILWGLAVNGEEGAHHVLSLVRNEIELSLALAGRPSVASVDRSMVKLGGW